ncbi:MAG: acyltransferase family protein [Candidatus Hermodarchaeota archaeon]
MTEINKITKLDLIEMEKEVSVESTDHYFQVDFLKAAMIFLVIFDHIVDWEIKSEIGVSLWERISIPVFLVIMGFNMGLSFKRHEATTLRELYSWRYFKSKILRYIVPFLVLYAFSTLLGLVLYQFNIIDMWYGQNYPNHGIMHLFIGFLPFWGPGNWFLPLLFQSILILPLIYWAFTKKPSLTLILCFIVEIVLQMILFFFIGEITTWEEAHLVYLVMDSVFFYLPAVGLGIWFSFGYKLNENRNFFMWFLYPISLAFIVVYQFFFYKITFNGVPLLIGDYHFLIIPYSAFLFLLAMKLLPQKSEHRISRGISLISKSTYHILLTQILGYGIIFAIWRTHYLIIGSTLFDALYLICAWIIFIPFGILWYKIDQGNSLIRRLLYYINFFLVFSIVVYYFFVILIPPIDWIPLSFIIILIYGLIYGGVGLIINFIVKKPIKKVTLGLWTLFLIINFVISVLYRGTPPLFQPDDYIFQNITIFVSLLFVIVGTVLDYTLRK